MSDAMSACKEVSDLIRRLGHAYSAEPFTLASGQLSSDYFDAKRAVANGQDLAMVAQAIADTVRERYTAVGGLTMGADPFAHAVAIISGCDWFSVRKEPKGRGLDRWIEGTELGAGRRVLLLDDVVTTGGSLRLAYERVTATGAEVVAACAVVDRGGLQLDIPFYALVTIGSGW